MNSCQYNTVTTNGIAICLCILANVQHNIVTDTLHTSSAHRHPNDTQWDGQQDVITYRHTIEISGCIKASRFLRNVVCLNL